MDFICPFCYRAKFACLVQPCAKAVEALKKEKEVVTDPTPVESAQVEEKEAVCEIGRWDDVAEEALKRAGFTVIDRAGIDDYQGWGVLLACNEAEFAILSWSYGSCSFCDAYEDLSDAERAAAFDDLIERGLTEQAARARFRDRKGW